ncbi:DUF1385 domain-containing protein [Candidatus Wolfebacteria bacterium]|nr:DUF1385 domain-containing protein [Candidatus Wolfebacteria bacterium]
MILPIFGYVGKKTVSISGMSNTKGFELTAYDLTKVKDGKLIKYNFETKYYSTDDFYKKRWIKSEIGGIVVYFLTVGLALYVTHFLNNPSPNIGIQIKSLIVTYTIAITSYIIFMNLISIIGIFKEKDLREWHALEHKSIVLLESNNDLTIENLKSCPTATIYCGVTKSAALTQLLILTIILPFIFVYLVPDNKWSKTFIIDIPIASIYLWLIHRKSFDFDDWPKIALMIISLPFTILPLLIQKLFTLKEPSEDKMKTVIRNLTVFKTIFNLNRS